MNAIRFLAYHLENDEIVEAVFNGSIFVYWSYLENGLVRDMAVVTKKFAEQLHLAMLTPKDESIVDVFKTPWEVNVFNDLVVYKVDKNHLYVFDGMQL